jgi:hypothetical protein
VKFTITKIFYTYIGEVKGNMNHNLCCNYFSTANCLIAETPNPPEDIKHLMEEYNRMLSMIYKRNTTKEEMSPISTKPYQLPELTASEKRLLKELEERIKASKGYGEYKTQRHRWEILM